MYFMKAWYCLLIQDGCLPFIAKENLIYESYLFLLTKVDFSNHFVRASPPRKHDVHLYISYLSRLQFSLWSLWTPIEHIPHHYRLTISLHNTLLWDWIHSLIQFPIQMNLAICLKELETWLVLTRQHGPDLSLLTFLGQVRCTSRYCSTSKVKPCVV